MSTLPNAAKITAGVPSTVTVATYPEEWDESFDDPDIEQSLIGPVFVKPDAAAVSSSRTELQACEGKDGTLSFERVPVRDEFTNVRPASGRPDRQDVVPWSAGEDAVRSAAAAEVPKRVGQPPRVPSRLRDWVASTPIEVSTEFASDADAKAIANTRHTRLRLASSIGLLEAVVMLAAMFLKEQLLVFCVDKFQRTDLIQSLVAGGITATDKDDLSAKVLVCSSTNELANPIRVQQRRIVVISDEANLTAPLMRELSHLPSTSRLIALSSLGTVNTNDDRQRNETWFGKTVRVRHTPVGPSRAIHGTFAVLKQGARPHANDIGMTAEAALRYHVFENRRWNRVVGRLINKEPSDWAKRLERCNRTVVREMAGPVVIVCKTLAHATNLLRESKRAVLAASSVGVVRKRFPDLRDRIRSVHGDLSGFDRIIVPIGDVRHLKFVGSVLRVDSLPGPLPLSEQQFANWSVSGITSPLHVVDLRRVDFRVGRANASSRAACYDADRTPMARAPKFQPHRFPPIRYVIGCGYGTTRVVYHRRPRAERKPMR